MAMSVFINFKGNCSEAVEFYAKAFGVEQQKMMRFGDSPDYPAAEEEKDFILYTALNVSDSVLMFSDIPLSMHDQLVVGNNISITLSYKTEDEVKKVFQNLEEDGIVVMEVQKTFWSDCYGMLVDKFGVNWQISLDEIKNF